jgi:hypothetical protein
MLGSSAPTGRITLVEDEGVIDLVALDIRPASAPLPLRAFCCSLSKEEPGVVALEKASLNGRVGTWTVDPGGSQPKAFPSLNNVRLRPTRKSSLSLP